jgi:hemerythrin superfamily protein
MNPIRLIKQDHRTVKGLFRRFKNADRHSEKQKLGQEIIEELSVHAAIEEQLIYPLLRARGESMEDAVLNALEEHHAVKLVLAELDNLSADHERYAAKIHVVCESVAMHIEEEESKILPRLERALDADDRKILAESMLRMKQTAPNHPHPDAADTPPTGVMAALIAKLTDSGTDVVRRITDADKAAGHRRVTRRASAANKPRRSARGKARRTMRGKARRSMLHNARRSTRSASRTRKARKR